MSSKLLDQSENIVAAEESMLIESLGHYYMKCKQPGTPALCPAWSVAFPEAETPPVCPNRSQVPPVAALSLQFKVVAGVEMSPSKIQDTT